MATDLEQLLGRHRQELSRLNSFGTPQELYVMEESSGNGTRNRPGH